MPVLKNWSWSAALTTVRFDVTRGIVGLQGENMAADLARHGGDRQQQPADEGEEDDEPR
jgi:hypothetical protein